MSVFQPPPTYTMPVQVDPSTGASSFDPIWLKWFVDFTANLSATGAGTVTNVSVTTANGVSGAVANPTSTPAITLALGIIAPTSVNKITFTTPATGATLTLANGKTLTVSNSLTLAGTDATAMTFPATSATLARADAAQTFTGVQTFSSTVVGSVSGSAATVTTNANLTGVVTSTGNATAIADTALSIAKTSGLQAALDGKQPLDAALTALAAGSDFVQFAGPLVTTKVFTLPNADSTLLAADGTGAALTAVNAITLLSATWASPAAIGTGMPAAGTFTVARTSGYTVATLPAGAAGMRAYVTDATAPAFLAALVGGGAVVSPAFYNGTAWIAG